MITIEICANSIQSALYANKAGAHRIELCEGIEIGGITPSYSTLINAKKHIYIPIHVLIRPRAGNFTYSNIELDMIEEDILLVKNLGFEGIVIGLLDRNAELPVQKMKRLLLASSGLSVTFNRAIDWARDPMRIISQLIDFGVDRVLTSGQHPTAFQGINNIRKMQQSFGKHISVMAGSGINKKNILDILKQTGIHECHLTAKAPVSISKNQQANIPYEMVNNLHEMTHYESKSDSIKQIIALTKEFDIKNQ